MMTTDKNPFSFRIACITHLQGVCLLVNRLPFDSPMLPPIHWGGKGNLLVFKNALRGRKYCDLSSSDYRKRVEQLPAFRQLLKRSGIHSSVPSRTRCPSRGIVQESADQGWPHG